MSRSDPLTYTTLSLGRTHINSCDFCVKSYSFDDVEDDFDLDNFDTEVRHDLDSGMVGMMLLASRTATDAFPEEGEYGMRIIASPWSPPPWMKAPTDGDGKGAPHAENMTGSALPVCIRDGVGKDSEYARSWAHFFSKFITACECPSHFCISALSPFVSGSSERDPGCCVIYSQSIRSVRGQIPTTA